MQADKLIFVIHDPNTPDVTVQRILPVLLELNERKTETELFRREKENAS